MKLSTYICKANPSYTKPKQSTKTPIGTKEKLDQFDILI